MARTTHDDLVVARESFFVGNTLVRAGDVWAAGDRVVAGRPHAFKPLEVSESDPERAPRQRPAPRRPATRKAPSKSAKS